MVSPLNLGLSNVLHELQTLLVVEGLLDLCGDFHWLWVKEVTSHEDSSHVAEEKPHRYFLGVVERPLLQVQVVSVGGFGRPDHS